MSKLKDQEKGAFEKSSGKTYTLVEIVKAPLTKVDKGPDDTEFTFPIVIIWEVILFLGVMALLVGFSLIKNAPLEEIANPLITTDPAKAPWYFMGLQELLEHMHPFFAGIALPGMLVAFLMAIPYLDQSKAGIGRWFTSERGKIITKWTALYAVIVFPAYAVIDNFFPPRELLHDILPTWATQSLIPFSTLVILAFIPLFFVWRLSKGKATMREYIMALFTVMFMAGVALTIIGFFFRGPGFELYWPWDMPPGYFPLDNL
jgi:hypothetical protein